MKKLDIYLANLLVVNVKLHNLHWNVRGLDFKPVHEYLEGLYDNFFAAMDEVAEWQKMNGINPKASCKDFLSLASIQEMPASEDIATRKALEIALADLKLMRDLALEIRSESSEEQFSLANMMEDHIEKYAKEIWFLESMLK